MKIYLVFSESIMNINIQHYSAKGILSLVI